MRSRAGGSLWNRPRGAHSAPCRRGGAPVAFRRHPAWGFFLRAPLGSHSKDGLWKEAALGTRCGRRPPIAGLLVPYPRF